MNEETKQKLKDCDTILEKLSSNNLLHNKLQNVQEILKRNNEIIEKIIANKNNEENPNISADLVKELNDNLNQVNNFIFF